MSGWQQYPDSTLRETYPPLPRTMGNPNAVASERVTADIAARHTMTVQHEAEFRVRQYARRLQTRGAAAMRSPEEAPPLPAAVPDDPALAEYKAAGWV